MTAQQQDFQIPEGNSVSPIFTVTDQNGVAVDISGAQDIIWTAQLDLASAAAITKKKSVSSGVTLVSDGTDGKFQVNFVAADTAGKRGFYFHQAQLVDGSGNVSTVAVGRVQVGFAGAWTYSGDPASSDKDAIRYLIGDTQPTDPLVFDAEVAFAFVERGSRFGAAAMICRSLATRFAREASTSDGKMNTGLNQKASAFSARAKEYESQASEKSALVFVAGLPSCYLQ